MDNQENCLKRSNSAPMINLLGTESDTKSPSPNAFTNQFFSLSSINASQQSPVYSPTSKCEDKKIRRISPGISNSGLHSPTNVVKTPSRLDQIKHEECFQVLNEREITHERDVQTSMQINQCCDSLSLHDTDARASQNRPKSLGEPLHIFTTPFPCSSTPSPTRPGKQCFSPGLGQPVSRSSFTPSPSPSPTRKNFVRRSLSPITFRPSPLSGLKRKVEDPDNSSALSPCSPKRQQLAASAQTLAMSIPLAGSEVSVSRQLSWSASSTPSSPRSDTSSPMPSADVRPGKLFPWGMLNDVGEYEAHVAHQTWSNESDSPSVSSSESVKSWSESADSSMGQSHFQWTSNHIDASRIGGSYFHSTDNMLP